MGWGVFFMNRTKRTHPAAAVLSFYPRPENQSCHFIQRERKRKRNWGGASLSPNYAGHSDTYVEPGKKPIPSLRRPPYLDSPIIVSINLRILPTSKDERNTLPPLLAEYPISKWRVLHDPRKEGRNSTFYISLIPSTPWHNFRNVETPPPGTSKISFYLFIFFLLLFGNFLTLKKFVSIFPRVETVSVSDRLMGSFS